MQTSRSSCRRITRGKACTRGRSVIWMIVLGLCLFPALVHAQHVPSQADPAIEIQSTKRQYPVFDNAISILRRSIPVHTLEEPSSQCSEVHKAEDQCLWVLEKCEDQDSGLLSYLKLYYCRLPQAKPVAMILMLLWLSMLFSTIGITASDYFCVNLSTISTFLGLSESVTGVTLLAFGNGSPDVFSTWAAMSTNSGSLAVGELIGAASFITAIVAGSMAIVRPFKVARTSFVRDLGFFIVATAFSLFFLNDGHLELWECIVMVVFYVFYVIVVFLWHWRSKRRKARKTRDLLAREHFVAPEYSDAPRELDEDEDGPVSVSRGRTPEDEFTLLERSARNLDEDNEDEDTRDRYMAELTTSMRLNRPRGISRENTRNPIRPSLVGALEFRAVLSSLERSRSTRSIPLYMRRNSEDMVTTIAQQNRLNRANSDLDPIAVPPPEQLEPGRYTDEPTSARPRAVSTNALDPIRTPGLVPPSTRLPITPAFNLEHSEGLPRLIIPSEVPDPVATEDMAGNTALLTPASAERSPHLLSPVSPTDSDPTTVIHQPSTSLDVPGSIDPRTISTIPDHSNVSTSQPSSHFHPYYDYSRRGSHASSLLLPQALQEEVEIPQRIVRWWPYRFLPPPQELFSTLFPTLRLWSHKSWSQRVLAVWTAPSIFLLNITLPVVEMPAEEDEKTDVREALRPSSQRPNPQPGPQTPRIRTEDEHGQIQATIAPSLDAQSEPPSQSPAGWHRWLLCTQLVFAPLFVVVLMWANVDDDHDTESLLFYLAVGLITSLVILLVILLTTNEHTPPRYRPAFCILGFIVSVSWISTIANEVVGILKALGIILNISEAILGLTVFAVGSSLGDLVADITIARLGYPMMALSACFGGPMLNILLGIGLSGIYLLMQRGEKYHHKHPDRPIRYKSYHIEIDRTLFVSSITLLITLVGLMIAVPMNGWRMSRRIGWALVGIWVCATVVNLGLEIGGAGKG